MIDGAKMRKKTITRMGKIPISYAGFPKSMLAA